jgi:glycosyl transferase family 87
LAAPRFALSSSVRVFYAAPSREERVHGVRPQGPTRLAQAALLVLLASFVTTAVLRPLVRPYAWSDFVTFYSASEAFATGRNPYAPETLRAAGPAAYAGWIGRYFYPPPFAAVAVRPLLALPFEVARRIWVVCECVAYLLALALLAEVAFGARTPVTLAWVAALGLTYAPFQLDLKLGSVSGVLLLLLALFLRERRNGHPIRAAVALGGAIALKLSPVLVVADLAWRGERRLAAAALGAAVAIAVASLPWTGVHVYADYTTQVLPYLLTANFSWFTNQSLDAFFWRLLVPNPDTTPWLASPGLHRVCTLLSGLAVLAGLTLHGVSERRREPGAPPGSWGPALALLASLLLAHVTWESMLVLALPCFALWLAAAVEGRAGGRVLLAAALAYALCALPFPYAERPLRSGWGLLLESPRLYGMGLAFAATFYDRLRQPRTLAAG